MPAQIIDGKAIAQEIRAELKASLVEGKRKPGLAVILVGDDPASHFYVRSKQKTCAEVGFDSFKTVLPADTAKAELIKVIQDYNSDPKVDGILLQLPLPEGLKSDTQEIIDQISPSKDADGLTIINQGKLLNYADDAVEPCTPKGCIELIKRTGIDMSGKKALVVGRSNLVGRPLSVMLSRENATVTLAHSRTQNLQAEVAEADILIAAIGRKEFIPGDWVKPGSVVIDVGINAEKYTDADGNEKSKLYGDVEFAAAEPHAAHITPVPGGVGPMTIAMLLKNTYLLYLSHNEKHSASEIFPG